MSDDLVKRLRDHIAVSFDDRGHVFEDDALCDDAADRIEELEDKLRKSALQELSALGQASEAYQAQLAAEVKLAKAVEVAEKSIKWLRLYGADVHREAATLAELTSSVAATKEGGKDG